MGRQFNFYMSSADEADFLAFLEALQLVFCRRDCMSEDEIAPIPLTSDTQLPRDDIIVFCNKADWPDMVVHPTKWGFMVGWGSSPCVEWSTCGHHPSSVSAQKGHITRGRVYCEAHYFDGHLMRAKSDQPIKMYERVRRHLKKICVETTEPREFAAPDAARLSQAGRVKLIMEGADPAKCRGTEIAPGAAR